MFELDLSGNPVLERQRDIFLIGCYTAQRYSDYSKIQKDNIKNLDTDVRVIELTQQKTNETVIIPIRPELEKLLAKYDYTVPKTYDQKVNKGIKEVGSMLGINEPIVKEKYQGGKKVTETVPKYMMIQTHTARRSGCTNMYLAGIPTLDIMKISGHKTEKEFLKYIRVTKRQTAVSLAGHEYFSGK
jgi:integrase